MSKIKIIGLTGQTGAGKSTVSELFRARGLAVINCDRISHEVSQTEQRFIADLALEFSVIILNADGTPNRKRLASMVFSDPKKLARLNELIFPYICERIRAEIDRLEKTGEKLVVLDAPTLFESGMDKQCDFVISVIAPEAERLNRIILRDRLTDDEARRRVGAQHNDAFYTGRSKYVVNNDAKPDDLRIRVLELLDTLEKECI
jgi:dephospho-CoA kinase